MNSGSSSVERTLYLIRHGQLDLAAFAKNQRTAGLTHAGRKQASLTARRLRSGEISSIHCSTIERARQTAEIISSQFDGIVVRASNLLREVPNLDSVHFAETQGRAEQAFTRYVRPSRQPKNDVLISHGNLIRYLVCRALGIAPEATSLTCPFHCAITQLRISGDGTVQLICYNETGHLQRLLGSSN